MSVVWGGSLVFHVTFTGEKKEKESTTVNSC